MGLHLDPPTRAVIVTFDENTQVHALGRTQASLPIRPRSGGDDDARLQAQRDHRPVAALNIATGEVLTECRKHYTALDVLRFFKLIDLHMPKDLDIHVILDNLSAHKAREIRRWLADPRRGR